MKIINCITYGFGKFSIAVIRLYMLIRFRPKAHFENKELQTNKFKEPKIIIANHTSLYDALLMSLILKGKVLPIVAKDWYEKKNIHWILEAAECIPCDRFNMDTEWINLAKKEILKGRSILIFPEGKIRTDGELNEFKSGFAFLARYTGVDVVSIGLDGNYKGMHKIHYVVAPGESVPRVKGNSSEYLQQKAEYFQAKVKDLKAKAIAYGNK